MLKDNDIDLYKSYILKNYKILSYKEISDNLNISISKVRTIMQKLDIRKENPKCKYYTSTDIEFLKNNHDKYYIEELSKILNHSIASINYKLRSLDLIKSNKRQTAIRQRWSKEDEKFLIHHIQENENVSTVDLAKTLNRTVKAVYGFCHERKICRKPSTANKRIRGIFRNMISRCYLLSDSAYYRYGGRGIKICNSWLLDVNLFEQWSLQNGYSEDLSIDRIDNDGNYCPENCRWTNRKQQANNTRKNRMITAFGETKTVAEWNEDHRCSVKYGTLYSRIDRGWEVERAIITPNIHIKNNGNI